MSELEVGDLCQVKDPHLSLPVDGRTMRVEKVSPTDGASFHFVYLSNRPGARFQAGLRFRALERHVIKL